MSNPNLWMRKPMLKEKESTHSGIANMEQNRDSKNVVTDLYLGYHTGGHSL